MYHEIIYHVAAASSRTESHHFFASHTYRILTFRFESVEVLKCSNRSPPSPFWMTRRGRPIVVSMDRDHLVGRWIKVQISFLEAHSPGQTWAWAR